MLGTWALEEEVAHSFMEPAVEEAIRKGFSVELRGCLDR